jgi:hypothetical protein
MATIAGRNDDLAWLLDVLVFKFLSASGLQKSRLEVARRYPDPEIEEEPLAEPPSAGADPGGAVRAGFRPFTRRPKILAEMGRAFC